jgi:hypothetical protein
MVEHAAVNRGVAGSSPASGASLLTRALHFLTQPQPHQASTLSDSPFSLALAVLKSRS